MEDVIAAFSQFERGNIANARKNFLFATFNIPLGVEIVINGRAKKPKEFLESEDYNGGIELRATIGPYLSRRSAKSKAFFSALLAHPDVLTTSRQ